MGGVYGSSNQKALLHRRVLPEWGDIAHLGCVHGVKHLQATGSLFHVVFAGHLTNLCDCLTQLCLRVPQHCAATLLC